MILSSPNKLLCVRVTSSVRTEQPPGVLAILVTQKLCCAVEPITLCLLMTLSHVILILLGFFSNRGNFTYLC